MIVDYQALNWQTKKDLYPLPWIDDLLVKLSCTNFLSAIDLASGYQQIGLIPEDCEKTVLIMHYGLFEYTVLPLGLYNTPSTFQCLMTARVAGSC